MGCVGSARRFLICVLDLLCINRIKDKNSVPAPATERRMHNCSKTGFLTFIYNSSLFCIRHMQNNKTNNNTNLEV